MGVYIIIAIKIDITSGQLENELFKKNCECYTITPSVKSAAVWWNAGHFAQTRYYHSMILVLNPSGRQQHVLVKMCPIRLVRITQRLTSNIQLLGPC